MTLDISGYNTDPKEMRELFVNLYKLGLK